MWFFPCRNHCDMKNNSYITIIINISTKVLMGNRNGAQIGYSEGSLIKEFFSKGA